MPQFKLLRGNSGEGRELIARNSARIDDLRRALGATLLTERESDMLRGRIAELLKLNDALQNPEDDTP